MKLSNAFGYALLGTCLYGAVTNSFLTDEEKDDVGEIDATNEVECAACAAALGLKTTIGLTQGEIVAAIRGVGEIGRVDMESVENGREGLESAAGETRRGTVLGRFQWGIRGAWDDDFYLAFGAEWVFPFGTNHLAGVVVYSQGGLAASSYDEPFVALPVPVAIVPREGSFTVEQTTSNSYIFAWWDVRPGRTATETLDAQIELFRNGDYCVSTNGVIVERYIRGNPYPEVPIGQDEDYRDWVDEQIGVGLENGLYKFTASFPVAPPESTILRVGEESVVVTNAGEYVFLLEKGREYEFETIPYDPTVEYWMQDDLADCPVFANWWWEDDVATWTEDGGTPEIRRQTRDEKGRCLWMPLFRGSPDVSHIGPDDALEFVALFEDYCHEDGVSYNWYCEDSNVVIESPHSRVTTVRFEEMPNWRSASLSVEATIGAYVLRSALATFSYGTNSVPEPASVSVSFDKKAIVYEKAYTESNGQEVPHRSTSSVLHCFARGGTNGGLVTFGIAEGDDRVQHVSGESLPFSRRLRAGEEISFDVMLKGVARSEATEDVEAYGRLEESGASQSQCQSNDRLTVVEVETLVQCNWIEFVHRKRMGVGEEMWVSLYPEEVNDEADVLNCEHQGIVWTCKDSTCAQTLTLGVRYRGASFDIPIVVIEPDSLGVESFSADENASVGVAGGIVGFYGLVVQPTNVSFAAIRAAELPSVSTDASGYFAQDQFRSLLDHGQHGAGRWHGLNLCNRFTDIISISELPEPWQNGGEFSWPIQNAWILRDSPAVTNILEHRSGYDQRFVLDSNGTTTISKFGYSTQRTTNDVLTITRNIQ